jgi:hypothetical protein
MKQEVINIIRFVGLNINEIFYDIEISKEVVFNSIEYRYPDQVILHIFLDEEDLDIEVDWDDIIPSKQIKILKKIRPLLLN